MKIFAEPSEFQLPIVETSSSLRQHHHGGNSITHNLLGMETPPTPLLLDTYNGDAAGMGGDLDTNYATILNYSINNNSSSSNNNNSSSSALANNSRSTNNTINLIDADYQTLRNPRVPPVSMNLSF
jgi:hypothetical protein